MDSTAWLANQGKESSWGKDGEKCSLPGGRATLTCKTNVNRALITLGKFIFFLKYLFLKNNIHKICGLRVVKSHKITRYVNTQVTEWNMIDTCRLINVTVWGVPIAVQW